MEEQTVSTKTIFRGKILDLKVDTVRLPNGKTADREVVVHPGAVAVVAVTDEDEILMVRQYRYPVGETLLEIPAGKLEKGEDPLECAKRELAEETGYGARQWEHLSTFYSTPGFSDEIMHLFLARNLYVHTRDADDDEFIEIHRLTFDMALGQIEKKNIKDAKTIAGILLAMRLAFGASGKMFAK